jgi:uncharacterized protein (DUF2141 family)
MGIHKIMVCVVATVLVMVMVAVSVAGEMGTLTMEATGLENSDGFLMVALYGSRKNYEGGLEMAMVKERVAIVDRQARVVFEGVPYGWYAASLFHDENSNGELDSNLLGLPKEAYGFSNNARSAFGPPDFDKVKFEVNTPRVVINVVLD